MLKKVMLKIAYSLLRMLLSERGKELLEWNLEAQKTALRPDIHPRKLQHVDQFPILPNTPCDVPVTFYGYNRRDVMNAWPTPPQPTPTPTPEPLPDNVVRLNDWRK